MSLPILQSEPWHRFSAIRAGMAHVSVISPVNEAELLAFAEHSRHIGLCLHAIGNGTNLIGSDMEEPSLCLIRHHRLNQMEHLGDGLFRAQAGISLHAFILGALRHHFGGLSSISGIPGSLGGALSMNAGANGGAISDVVQEMHGVNLVTCQPWRWKNGDGGWGYRLSPVPPTVSITSALLQLQPISLDDEAAAITAEAERRRRVTPPGFSCGSVFRNPDGTPAGKLLEEAGCKGMTIGPFTVSPKHANWIVNSTGQPGRATDCLELTRQMRQAVLQRFGIPLQLEWRTARILSCDNYIRYAMFPKR